MDLLAWSDRHVFGEQHRLALQEEGFARRHILERQFARSRDVRGGGGGGVFLGVRRPVALFRHDDESVDVSWRGTVIYPHENDRNTYPPHKIAIHGLPCVVEQWLQWSTTGEGQWLA